MQANHTEYISVSLAERTVNEKLKLNQHATISRLHPEIFSTIFCYVRDSVIAIVYGLYPSLCRTARYWQELSRLTHVCHSWREIAIDTPTLWAKICVSAEAQKECMQQMLYLSKQCSLSVFVSTPSLRSLSGSDLVGQILHNHVHRFRELILLDIEDVDLHTFFSNPHNYWHRLEYLHISIPSKDSDTSSDSSGSDTSSDSGSSATFTLSNDVICVDSLRHLSIVHGSLDFQSTFLLSLTHLELSNIDKDCRLSCSDFIAVLVNIPALEILNLEGFLKEAEVDDVEDYVATRGKTHLRRIKYFDLSCHVVREMAQFLCTLILPSSCKLRLHISDQDVAITPIFRLITSWLSQHFQPPSSPQEVEDSFPNYFRSLRVEDTSASCDEVFVSGFCGSLTKEVDDALLLFGVSWEPDDGSIGGSIDDFWKFLLITLPLSNLTSLEVMDDSMTLLDSIWVKVFAPITTLTTVIIVSEEYGTFFDAASPSSMASPFPGLSSVTVKAYCITGIHYHSMLTSLELRLEAGLAPLDLIFHTDNIQLNAITRLADFAWSIQVFPM